VIWIWMENHQSDQVIGEPQAPFESALARECGTAAHYSAVGSPSLPNYLAATSGSTQGVHDDGSPSKHRVEADNLFRQVRASGGTARTYAEAMPAPCALQSTGRYAVKHNPAAYYVGDDDRHACTTDDVPLGTLETGPLVQDLAAGTLPTFAFVVPDLCHDTHDCSVADGDRWLAAWIGKLVADPTYREGSTALFVVWDEPTPMPFLAIAPAIHQAATVSEPVDHYSLLRTTEELLGIDTYLGAASRASSVRSTLGL
jgi:phospholipase C